MHLRHFSDKVGEIFGRCGEWQAASNCVHLESAEFDSGRADEAAQAYRFRDADTDFPGYTADSAGAGSMHRTVFRRKRWQRKLANSCHREMDALLEEVLRLSTPSDLRQRVFGTASCNMDYLRFALGLFDGLCNECLLLSRYCTPIKGLRVSDTQQARPETNHNFDGNNVSC